MKVVNRRGSCQQPSATRQKKAEGKRDIPPFTPYRENGRGKKNRPSSSGTGLSCAGGRVRARGGIRALIDAVLDEATAHFGGTAEDRRIWAAIAWRVGADRFLDAVFQAQSEIACHMRPSGMAERPRIFQNVLNARFPKNGGAA